VSSEKEKLDQLLAKVEEMSVTLNKVSEELHTVSASLKSLTGGQSTQPPTTKPPSGAPAVDSRIRTLDDIRMSFPEELEARLAFEERGEYIIIKPKQFLGSENFAKIASAVRGMGGEYISAGKDSHFRVPKRKA
jgi:hypothetical protein